MIYLIAIGAFILGCLIGRHKAVELSAATALTQFANALDECGMEYVTVKEVREAIKANGGVP